MGLSQSAWRVGLKWLGGVVNLMSNDGTASQLLVCRVENGLEGQII